ncbi:hypothetical protein CH75_18265 [Dyella jiangningensis]|jgi:hypothetical protein|uniref:hypothetical protein n=1 Tax=Dyella jiangningensis TaxID=1379159 RepID=UPI00045669FF|nr:hypothetical protein [Dyella jiangningensis]AHX14928.1 hypothetical protein CH75_18265 [Dyella jiangningensis]MDG2538366.1 hypothetical protein [Dyella jiangningensis]
MSKRVMGSRVLMGLAVAAMVAAPMVASAHDGWGRDNGYHRGWDRGGYHDRDGWRRDYGHHDGHWSGGRWIAGAVVAGAVIGLVQSAMAPAPTYYEQQPTVVYQDPPVVYRRPATVVYEQPRTVVYENAPVQPGTVVYGSAYGDDDGD